MVGAPSSGQVLEPYKRCPFREYPQIAEKLDEGYRELFDAIKAVALMTSCCVFKYGGGSVLSIYSAVTVSPSET
jgi:hypothetical protein